MARGTVPGDALLFTSLLFRDEVPAGQARAALEEHFGPLAFASAPLPFAYTSYYEKELGAPLQRYLLAFERHAARDALADIKTTTNAIEDGLARGESRTVNLDPGLLSLENICLATTKPYSHRIYLGRGIWAEVTLIYQGNSYKPLEWTYPDYGSDELIRIFNHLRQGYKEQRQCPEA